MTHKKFLSLLIAPALFSGSSANAHASEQTFVLLLPTEFYSSVGIFIVVFTILLMLALPSRISARIFSTISIRGVIPHPYLQNLTSLISFLIFLLLILIGFFGTHDPLTNLLPATVWTVWWITLFILQGVLGDIWRWINPWTGPYAVVKHMIGTKRILVLHDGLAAWPAVLGYLCFAMFLLVDLAPDNPTRLAYFVSGYWIITLCGMLLFGSEVWLSRCECFTIFFRFLAKLSPLRIQEDCTEIGCPAWQLNQTPSLTTSLSIFILTALACSSFDGLNETFWWLALIGVNPLEFPGRSAVVVPTIAGILGAVFLLICVFTLVCWVGNTATQAFSHGKNGPTFSDVFSRLALSLLPIAFGYHIAHYIPTLLVNGQYFLVALSDPFSTGANYLNLDHHFVTTGFFAEYGSVRLIWLTQCAAIVIGHVLAVLLGHGILSGLYGKGTRSVIAEIPLSILMTLYTLLSLWLLASPRGA